MNASKKKVPLALMSILMLVSFLVLVTAIKGDSVLRIALAAGGCAVFTGMYIALLLAGRRTTSA